MDYDESVRLLRGRVRALLTQVELAAKRKRPLEVNTNSRIFNELREALALVEGAQERRDAAQQQHDG